MYIKHKNYICTFCAEDWRKNSKCLNSSDRRELSTGDVLVNSCRCDEREVDEEESESVGKGSAFSCWWVPKSCTIVWAKSEGILGSLYDKTDVRPLAALDLYIWKEGWLM